MECVLRETVRLIIMSASGSSDRQTSKRYFERFRALASWLAWRGSHGNLLARVPGQAMPRTGR